MAVKRDFSVSEITDQYSQVESKLHKMRNAVFSQLTIIFEENAVQLGFPIQHRTKTLISITEKIMNGRFKPKKFITELQDLVGFRIILLFKRDIEILSTLLDNTFNVVKKYDTSEKLKDDQFGYSSTHYIIEIPEDWLKVPTFSGLGGIQAEVQIRTLSQHIWAEASNVLQYKQEGSAPKALLRSIGRVSALLETVDLEFERLISERENYRNELSQSSESVDKILNVDLVQSITDEKLPKVNKEEYEQYDEILSELEVFGISSSENLKVFIDKNIARALDDEKIQIREILESEVLRRRFDSERLRNGTHFNHLGLIRVMLLNAFPKRWSERNES